MGREEADGVGGIMAQKVEFHQDWNTSLNEKALMWEAKNGFPAFSLVIGALDISPHLSRFEIAGSRFAFILTKANPFYEGGASSYWLNQLYLYAYNTPLKAPRYTDLREAARAVWGQDPRKRLVLLWQHKPISFEPTSWDESQPWVIVVNGVFYGDIRGLWKP